ncbi:MAG: four helix bundle protein [bacterium]|nr:four helix bundle protein [bacterium]
MEKIKSTYIIWHKYHVILPQINRYTLGNRIDKLFIEIIENIATATFLLKQEKLPYLRLAIRKLDTLKILLMILWETKSVEDKKYITLSIPLEEIGKMLGGWHNQLIKQNSPAKAGEK